MHWEIVDQSQLGAGLGNRISGDRELAGDGGSCVVGSGLETVNGEDLRALLNLAKWGLKICRLGRSKVLYRGLKLG